MASAVEVARAATAAEHRLCSIEGKVGGSRYQLTSLNCFDGGRIGNAVSILNSIAYCCHSEFLTLAITIDLRRH